MRPCSSIRTKLGGAYLLSKKPQPIEPPRLNEVLRLTAQLGAFLARRGDGEPGVKTIWQGVQCAMDGTTVLDAREAWLSCV
jgi:hypothetical protein